MDDLFVWRDSLSLEAISFRYYIDGDRRYSVASARVFRASPGGDWALTGVWVAKDYRRQGYATALMNEIVKDADLGGWVLRLVSEPDSTTTMPKEALLEFYRSFGFVGEDGMVRIPANRGEGN